MRPGRSLAAGPGFSKTRIGHPRRCQETHNNFGEIGSEERDGPFLNAASPRPVPIDGL